MAVAVKNAPATTPVTPPRRLADLRGVDTLIGVAYLIAAVWLVFFGLPLFWANVLHFTDSFLGIALLMLAMVVVAGVLGFVGVRRMGPKPRPGLRAGIVVGAVLVCIAGLITSSIGHSLEATLGATTGATGVALTVVVLVLLLAFVAWALTRPTFERWMVNVDAQGWFTFAPYKRTQGQKVRRGTILGILILWACGIYSLVAHWAPTPVGQPMPAWDVYIPFSGGQSIGILPALHITVPVLLAIAAFWFAYRVVSLPVFADFLIATEAEMNKVSWTTRQRLIQDTVVVLVTVVLLTFFLFVVDYCWSWALQQVDVIHTPPPSAVDQTPHW